MSNASYLKLKDKISKLEKDINTLVFHPESYEAFLIRARKGFIKDSVNSILYGQREDDLKMAKGILDAMNGTYTEDEIKLLETNGLIIRYPLK